MDARRLEEFAHLVGRDQPLQLPENTPVRVRVSNDLRVVFHEYGHHLDLAIMQGSKLNALNPIAQELKALGAPTSKPSYSPKKRRQEGAAEFFVAWMTAPETLAAKAPRYLVEFQRFLEDHPDLREGLEGLQLETQRYLSADPLTQAELHIDFGDSGLVRRVVETFAGSEEDPRTLWDKLNDSRTGRSWRPDSSRRSIR